MHVYVYRQEWILAVSRLPQTQNNHCKIIGVLELFEELKFFSCAPGWPDDPWQVSR
jgi:hypothetical protein